MDKKTITKKDVKDVVVNVIEPFARTVQSEFVKVNSEFIKVNKRFDKVDSRLDKVDSRLDKVEFEIYGLKHEMQKFQSIANSLFTRFDKFIALYEKQEHELLILNSHFKKLEERVAKLEIKIAVK